jgi:hypothetical protein
VRPDILAVIAAFLAFTYNNVYQITCTQQNTAGNSPVLTFCPKLWLLGMENAARHLSEAKN